MPVAGSGGKNSANRAEPIANPSEGGEPCPCDELGEEAKCISIATNPKKEGQSRCFDFGAKQVQALGGLQKAQRTFQGLRSLDDEHDGDERGVDAEQRG